MSDPSGFTAFVPGFDFIKNLGQQANAWTQPSATGSPPGMPPMAAWVAPTFDVEELDKRINELKSVQFWLEQNARALAATIQAMEVQKMTLSTLKQMDVGMEDAVKAMQANPADLWRAWQTEASGMAGGAAPTPAAPKEDKIGHARRRPGSVVGRFEPAVSRHCKQCHEGHHSGRCTGRSGFKGLGDRHSAQRGQKTHCP